MKDLITGREIICPHKHCLPYRYHIKSAVDQITVGVDEQAVLTHIYCVDCREVIEVKEVA